MANLGNNTSLKDALSAIDSKVVQAEKDRNKLEAHLLEKGTELTPGSKMSVLIDKVPLVKGFPKGWDEEVVAETYGSSIAEGDPIRKLTLPGFSADMIPTSGLYTPMDGAGIQGIRSSGERVIAQSAGALREFIWNKGVLKETPFKFYPPVDYNNQAATDQIIFKGDYVAFNQHQSNYVQVYKMGEDSYSRVYRESHFRLCGLEFNQDCSRLVIASSVEGYSPIQILQRNGQGGYDLMYSYSSVSGYSGGQAVTINDEGNMVCVVGSYSSGGTTRAILYKETTPGVFTHQLIDIPATGRSCQFKGDHLLITTDPSGVGGENVFVYKVSSEGILNKLDAPFVGELPSKSYAYYAKFTPSGKYLFLIGGSDKVAYLYRREGDNYHFVCKNAEYKIYRYQDYEVGETPEGKPYILAAGTSSNANSYNYLKLEVAQLIRDYVFSLSTFFNAAYMDTNNEGIMVTGYSNRLDFFEEYGDFYKSIPPTMSQPNANISSVKFSPSGTYLAVTSDTSASVNIAIYKRVSKREYTKLPQVSHYPAKAVRSVSWSPDERMIVLSHDYLSSIGAFTLYRRDGDIFTKLPTQSPVGHSYNSYGAFFGEDNKTFVTLHLNTSSAGLLAKVWEVNSDRTQILPVSRGQLVHNSTPVGVTSYSSDTLIMYGKSKNAAEYQAVFIQLDLSNKTLKLLPDPGIGNMNTYNIGFSTVSVSPGGSHIVTGTKDSGFKIYERISESPLKFRQLALIQHDAEILSSVFSKGGNLTIGKVKQESLSNITLTTFNSSVKDIITKYDYKVPVNKGIKVGVALESKNAGEQIKANLFPKIGLL